MRKIISILMLIYVSSCGVSWAQLADSAWPMRGQNPQHTGRGTSTYSTSSTVKWKFLTGNQVWSSPAIDSEGTIYVGSVDKYIYAINSDGTLKWKYQTDGMVRSSPSVGTDGAIYFGSFDSYLYAINSNGTLKWKYQTGNEVQSAPAISLDGTIYVGSVDKYLYAINSDGTLKWKYLTEGNIYSSPAICADGTICVGSYDGYIYAINSNGTLKWKYQTGDYIGSSPAIGLDGIIYVGSWDKYLYAINSDGTLKWKYQTGSDVQSSPAIGIDGTLYIGSKDSYLYAITSEGILKWKYQTTGNQVSSSPAIGTDGTIYVGSYDRYLYAIKSDGSLKWKSQTAGPTDISAGGVYSSPAIGLDGTVYVGSVDSYYLYAFTPEPPSLTLSSPNGSENWTTGSSHNITWTSSGVTNIKLEYSTNNGSTWNTIIASITAVSGSYTWTIPNTSSTNCKIRISDAANSTVNDTSDLSFTIAFPQSVTMISIPSGSFTMGQVGTEEPLHIVNLSGFEMSKYEITQGQYQTIKGSNPSSSYGVGDNYPVYNVNWWDVIKFCNTLSINAGFNKCYNETSGDCDFSKNGYRLPTEAEWEYACRAGTTTKFYNGTDSENNLRNFGWYNDNSYETTHPVGEKTPNAFGLYDMHGNVWEWCNDWYSVYTPENVTNPLGVQTGSDRVFRGGCWGVNALTCQSAIRAHNQPDNEYKVYIGFRVVRGSFSTSQTTLSSPNEVENWTAGTTQNIIWSSSGVTNVKLEYSTDNGSTWTTIIASTPANAGTYSWTVPNVTSSQCLIKISDASNLLVNDQSNSAFTITTTKSVVVTSPNGGENFTASSQTNIRWTSQNVSNVKIEYSANGGSSWTTIVESTASDGEFNWTIPKITSSNCLIRISDVSNSAINDVSNAVFTIVTPKSVTVTSPNGGESWITGTSHNINWTHQNLTAVKIEYSSNNGSTWASIIESYEASVGSYSWTIPNAPSTTCLIRISDASDSQTFDISNSQFSIASPPTISLTFPNGGENLNPITQRNITWTSTNIANVKIEFSSDNGVSWSTIITSTPASSGSYSWIVPNTLSTNCKIRVSDVSNSAVNDIGDAVFAIAIAPTLANSAWPMFSGNPQHTGRSKSFYSASGTVKWQYQTDSAVSSSPVIGSDGTVYVGSFDNNLYAINSDGTLKWKYQTGYIVYASPAIATDGTVYVGSWDKYLYAINSDGTLKWKYQTNDYIYSSPAIGTDGIVYVGSGDNNLYAINSDGTLKWKYQTGNPVSSSPAIGTDGTVYVGSHDNNLYAINSDGTLKWKYQTGSGIQSSPAIESDGTVYVSSYDNNLYAINSDGTLKWKYQTCFGTPAIGTDGTVYVGSGGTVGSYYLYAIKFDGTLKWKCRTSSPISSSPAINANGIVYFGTDGTASAHGTDASFYAVNIDGTLKWVYQIGQQVVSSPAIDMNGTVYVGSHDGHLYAFAPENPLVTLTSLNGGESFTSGSIQNITWTSQDIEYVKLEYSADNGTNWNLITSNTSVTSGSYSWTVPNISSTNCLVRITDASNGAIFEVSDGTFSIAPNNLSLTYPNGNEILSYGTKYDITWTSKDVEKIKIEYTVNDGLSWIPIGINVSAGLGNFEWSVPNVNSTKCLIRISDYSNGTVQDISDSTFTIVIPTITVTSPNGGEILNPGSTYNVTWSYTNVNAVELEYSTDNGTTWSTFVLSISASLGSYPWSVPEIISSNCLIRISAFSNSLIYDNSDSAFSISIQGGLADSAWPMFGQNPQHTGRGIASVVASNNLKWKYLTSDGTEMIKSSVIAEDGTIYIGSGDGHLYGIKPDGSLKIKFDTNNKIASSPAIGKDGTIYVGNVDNLYAINSDGSLKWKYPSGAVYSSPTINVNGIIYVGFGGYLNAINPDGTLKWRFRTGEILASPAFDNLGIIYVGDNNKDFYAINSDGTLKWKFQAGDYITSSATIGNDGIIYFGTMGSYDDYLYALNTDGTLKWKFKTENNIDSSPAISTNGTVYVGSYNDGLYAINSDGTLKWKFNLNDWISTPSIGANEIVFIGCAQFVYAFDPDGTLNWSYKTDSNVRCSPTIGDDGSLFIGSNDGYLYAFAPENPSVTLTSPNGGELFISGSSQNFTWTSSGLSNVKLEYSTNNGTAWTTIAASVSASAGSYSWIVPDVSSANCIVRISDTSNNNVLDTSDSSFSIIQRTISLTTPNGGENINYGTNYNITWTSKNVEKVRIEYTTNNGSTWILVGIDISASLGEFTWFLPKINSTQCKIRIRDFSDNSIFDVSDLLFTITIPTITVNSPNDGEKLIVGSTVDIAWTSSAVNNVKLDYSINNGTNWTTFVPVISASTKFYTWNVPDDLSSNCLIRITDVSNSYIVDRSDSLFSIVQNSITINSPHDGESLASGSIQNIAWSSLGVTNVNLEYSTDNGSSWTTIAETITTSLGSYSWTIPYISSDKCLIKISSVEDPSIFDQSNNAFSIVMPDIRISPLTIDIGNTPVGGSKSSSFTIFNDGTDTLRVSDIESSNGRFAAQPLINVIPPQDSLNVIVAFSPIVSGFQTAILTIRSNDYDEGSITVSVSGNSYNPCSIAISVSNSEISPDAVINYIVTNPDNDSVNLICEFSTDNGLTWRNATIEGKKNGINSDGYNGSFIWKGKTDLPGYDGKVNFRVTPSNIMAGLPDTKEIIIDYNEPPSSQVYKPEGEVSGTISIKYDLFDAENDNIHLKLEYSLDGTTYNGTVGSIETTILPGKDKTIRWDSFKDIGYVYNKDVYLRFAPSDNDAGLSDAIGPIKLINLIADYNFDLIINGDDLLAFSNAWYSQDTTKEIGPVSGEIPDLTVNRDSKINFEDLSVFAWMWNWSTSNSLPEKIVQKPTIELSGNSLLYPVLLGNGNIDIFSDKPLDFVSLEIIFNNSKYDAFLLPDEFWDRDGKGISLQRVKKDGSIEFAAARFGRESVISNATFKVAGISFGQESNSDDIMIYYKARVSGENTIYSGSCKISKDLITTKPEEVSLSQNIPNPFNPTTTIEYSVPRDTHIKLVVYNSSGQEVAILKDSLVKSGRYSVVWDAKGMPSGIYIYKLIAEDKIETKKMLLMK